MVPCGCQAVKGRRHLKSSIGQNLEAAEPRPLFSLTESGSVDTEGRGNPKLNLQESHLKCFSHGAHRQGESGNWGL